MTRAIWWCCAGQLGVRREITAVLSFFFFSLLYSFFFFFPSFFSPPFPHVVGCYLALASVRFTSAECGVLLRACPFDQEM